MSILSKLTSLAKKATTKTGGALSKVVNTLLDPKPYKQSEESKKKYAEQEKKLFAKLGIDEAKLKESNRLAEEKRKAEVAKQRDVISGLAAEYLPKTSVAGYLGTKEQLRKKPEDIKFSGTRELAELSQKNKAGTLTEQDKKRLKEIDTQETVMAVLGLTEPTKGLSKISKPTATTTKAVLKESLSEIKKPAIVRPEDIDIFKSQEGNQIARANKAKSEIAEIRRSSLTQTTSEKPILERSQLQTPTNASELNGFSKNNSLIKDTEELPGIKLQKESSILGPKSIPSTRAESQVENGLRTILDNSYTDVNKKVNILDYVRTPDRVLKKIGLENESKLLRKQYEKYVKELPVEIDKIRKWSGETTAEENTRIFKYLDGQNIVLSHKEEKIASEVKSYLKEWADKLKLPVDNRITNYITHIFDEELMKKEFPDELAKLIADKIPGSVYDPFVLKRLGAKGYLEDTWRALEAYVKRATRKYNLDPALQEIEMKASNLEKTQFDYVKKYIDRVNMRPAEVDTLADNLIKAVVGYKYGQRPIAKISRGLRQFVYRGALGLNFTSALRNLSQGSNTFAKLGTRYTLKGYFDMFKNWNTSELEDVGVLANNFVEDRVLSAVKKVTEKLDKGLFFLFDRAEKINRGAAYYGAKAKALRQGKTLEEAVEIGKKLVRDTQFAFGSIDTPVALNNDIVKVFTQFQSFTTKQLEFLGEMAVKKEFAGIARYIGASALFVATIGKVFGMDYKDMFPTYRFGWPPILKGGVEGIKAIVDAPDKYGKDRDAKTKVEDVANSFISFIPAGVQAKKSIQGVSDYAKGKSTTASGKTRYKIDKNLNNFLRSLVFGKYSTPEAQKYYDKSGTKKDARPPIVKP